MRELSHEKRKLSKRWVIHRLRYYMNEVGIKDFDYYDNLFSGVKIDFSKEKFLYTSSSYKKFSRDILEPLLILEEDAE